METAVLDFRITGIEDGLSQGMINGMAQDSTGFMWFATKDGLNRYDGYHFTVFRHNESDSTSLADNFVACLFVDRQGRLWAGTSGDGLDEYDPASESFIHFRTDARHHLSLANENIVSLSQDHRGILWVGTNHGTYLLNPGKDNNPSSSSLTLIDSSLNHSLCLQNGDVLLYGQSLVRYRFQPGGLTRTQEDLQAVYPNIRKNSAQAISAIYEDTLRHTLYYFSYSCISKQYEESGAIRILNQSPAIHSGYFSGSIAMDNKGNLWLCDFNWLIQLDTATGKMTHLLQGDKNLVSLNDKINGVFKDQLGNLWVGTKGFGILQYSWRKALFHSVREESVGFLGPLRNGHILLGTIGNFLYEFLPADGWVSQRIPDSITWREMNPLFRGGVADMAVQDPYGRIWITKSNLMAYDPLNHTLTSFSNARPFAFPLLLADSNHLWVGYDSGVSLLNTQNGVWSNYPCPFVSGNAPYRFMEAFYQDPSGILWIGSTAGVLRFNQATREWKQYKKIPGDSTSISNRVIFTICPDPANRDMLWLGTNGGGLNGLNTRTGKSVNYNEQDGLANNVIYGILSDGAGNLWMSTNRGIARFNLEKKVFTNFNINDGLLSDEFNRGAFCRGGDGMLYFGGVNGFNYFDPAIINQERGAGKVRLTQLHVNNQEVNFKTFNRFLRTPLYMASSLKLDYAHNMFSVDFSSMNFDGNNSMVYEYFMDGLDRHWIRTNENHSATYTNLAPGTYTFRVRARSNPLESPGPETTLQITVMPPWYMTWEFRISMLLLLALAVYGLFRLRLQQVVQVERIRNRIARDLHDEIGSTLSSISLYSEVADSMVKEKAPEVRGMLQQISDSTTSMMEAMSDIVWTINTQNDRFNNIINRMRALAVEILEAKNCALEFTAPDSLDRLELNMEQRKNFYLIFKEAINNTAKYAEAKKVTVHLSYQHRELSMEITDDGKGFDLRAHADGNGLKNMAARAAQLQGHLEIESMPGKGTHIRLRFRV